MARSTSPLRYPGGKTCLYPLMSGILRINKLEHRRYVEPFAGGCGLALALLYEGHVSDIYINDIDPSLWAFWHSVLNHNGDILAKVRSTPITVNEWHSQRRVHQRADVTNPVELGFSAFFLNRTNRSGIIKDAGVIGGLSQTGNYKIDCRFNRDELARRIQRVARYKSRIHLYRMDALHFIKNSGISSGAFFCVDPPYFNKGSSLYTNFYKRANHVQLAEAMMGLDNPWVITYDNAIQVSALYKKRRQYEFDVNYSVETKRLGTELLIASKGLRLPETIRDRQVSRPQYRSPKASYDRALALS